MYIVKSVLDTDFYKLLMLQLIWKKYRNTHTKFKVKNRTKDVDLNSLIDKAKLLEQLQHTTTLRFEKSHIDYLQTLKTPLGNNIFSDEFLYYLANEYSLAPVNLDSFNKIQDLNTDLEFESSWDRVTMWEIYVLPIINEMRYSKLYEIFDNEALSGIYNNARTKSLKKFEALIEAGVGGVSDFGTRRRNNYQHQKDILNLAKQCLGESFVGTSNIHLAREMNMTPIGTNAHEIPMTLAALALDDGSLKSSQYQVIEDWMHLYDETLWTVLPDTFGTLQFLEGAPPELMKKVSGIRIDSMDNIKAAELLINYWKSLGIDPKSKVTIFSDGLDADEIIKIHSMFHDKLNCKFGWGTTLTNDFVECIPPQNNISEDYLKPISLVCKVSEVNGKSAVKLSDNIAKATGSPDEVERYKKVFGTVDYSKELLV